MKNQVVLFGSLFLLLWTAGCQKESSESVVAPFLVPAGGAIPGQYIVQLKAEIMAEYLETGPIHNRETAAQASLRKLEYFKPLAAQVLGDAGVPSNRVESHYTEIFYGFALRLAPDELRRLLKHPSVLLIEQDMEVRLPDIRVEEDGILSRAQNLPCGIINAGGPADGSGSSKWCWIVDTGIDLDHPDLNVVTNSTYAKSFVGGSPDDCHGHGTHCAGIAAAKDNTVGVVGVSSGAPVVPVRVLNCKGSGTSSKILNGLNHVASYDEPGDVVNISLGGYWGSNCSSQSSYVTALTNMSNAGTRIAIAAGNSSANSALYTPACINAGNIHTAASMTCAKAWSSFSNYGVPPIDWIATGSSVYSTYKNGQYATMSGTSMAAPHLTGIMHSLQASPNQNGTVTYNGTNYKVATR